MPAKRRKTEGDGGTNDSGGRQAWVRAGAGLSLIAVLLVALSLFDKGVNDGLAPAIDPTQVRLDQAPSSSPPANIVSEPAEPLITTAIAVPGKEEAIDAALASDPPAVVPESSAAPEIVAAEARQADEPPLTAVAAASVEADDSPRLVLHSAPSEPDSAPAGAAPPPAKPAKPGKGFLLQLGVFGDTGNAQALYEELRRQGLPARLETRVVAGPFNSRKSAEAARERLARAGLARGLVVSER